MNIIIPEKIHTYFAAKIIGEKPSCPKKWNKVNAYKNEYKKFEDKQIEYRIKYPGISDADYDLFVFGSICVKSMINEIVLYTNVQNGIIYKDNLRLEQKYWFDLDPFEFEKEVAYWFEQQGYKSMVTPKSGDGGIDIIISKGEYKAYVQCKRYKTSKVDRPTLNALYGVVCADNVNQGIVVCLLGITDEANEFAKKVGIKVVTIDELAPKEDLFHHKVKKESLCTHLVKNNKYWIEIGKLKLNTNAYRTEKDILDQASKWINKDLYHPIEYHGIFLCIYGSKDDFEKFASWYSIKLKAKTYPKRDNRKKSYRRNKYWRY